MPPVDAAAYLLEYFWEIGPVLAGGMGPVVLTHAEILAWCTLSGQWLQPWETRALRSLSRDYIAQLRLAEKVDCPAPWQPQDYVPDRSAVARSMRDALRAAAAL